MRERCTTTRASEGTHIVKRGNCIHKSSTPFEIGLNSNVAIVAASLRRRLGYNQTFMSKGSALSGCISHVLCVKTKPEKQASCLSLTSSFYGFSIFIHFDNDKPF